jgi:hypothetical protein
MLVMLGGITCGRAKESCGPARLLKHTEAGTRQNARTHGLFTGTLQSTLFDCVCSHLLLPL